MDYAYLHLDWRELANRLARDKAMQEAFRRLLELADGDVEAALQAFEKNDKKWRQNLGFDSKEFERHLRERKLIQGGSGSRELAAGGKRLLRESAFREVFGQFKPGPGGKHLTGKDGGRGEDTGETRPWSPGDGAEDLALRESILASWRSGRDGLADEDLQVKVRERTGGAAWVLLIDVSHSMTLYGEDRITPARRVALALAEHLKREHPRDALDIFLFGDDVRPVTVDELPTVTNGPFHTNTAEALRCAAEVLMHRHQADRRVVMITDGKPTALFTGKKTSEGHRELIINSSYGLDPEIVTATLNQGARYPRLGIRLTVFMVATDPYLERFVRRLTGVTHGEAFQASLDQLGQQVLGRLFGTGTAKGRRR